MFIPSGYHEESFKKGGDLRPFGRGSMQSESCDHVTNNYYVFLLYYIEPFEEAT